MVLTVDIGNSNIVVGCFKGETMLFTERLSTDRSATALEYTVLIKSVFEIHNINECDFEGGIISSVVPSVTNILREAIEKLIGKSVMIIGPGIKTGLKIKTDNPAQVGCDRVADAVGALNEYPCPLITVDMGTATTISVVDKERNFLGGVIIPGLRVSLDSLTSRASQLPTISLEAPDRVIGSGTVECMKNGIIYSTASGIDGIIDRIEDELGEKCTVIATGGLSGTVIPFCEREIIIDSKLLLKGMMVIYNKNK